MAISDELFQKILDGDIILLAEQLGGSKVTVEGTVPHDVFPSRTAAVTGLFNKQYTNFSASEIDDVWFPVSGWQVGESIVQ